MGTVDLPLTGLIGMDANVAIYSLERHPRYSSLLRRLWEAVAAGQARVAVSELVILEALIGPYRAHLQDLAADYDNFIALPGLELIPITLPILRKSARLRAKYPNLRTPDAIHGATAMTARVDCFVTNDRSFKIIEGLNVVMLDDVLDEQS